MSERPTGVRIFEIDGARKVRVFPAKGRPFDCLPNERDLKLPLGFYGPGRVRIPDPFEPRFDEFAEPVADVAA